MFLDFFSCLVFLANSARRRVMSSLTYTVGPWPLYQRRSKCDDHWPWSCLRVCTWYTPSEPMTCHYVGALIVWLTMDSHLLVVSSSLSVSEITKNHGFVPREYYSSWSRAASTEHSLVSRAAIYSVFLSIRSFS